MRKVCLILGIYLIGAAQFAYSQRTSPLIINHSCMDITQIPESAINTAKSTLHIAYGHTSHGSQVTEGMSNLVGFMNGLGYPNNLYAYNSGGTGGALDLRDRPFSGASDLGNPNRTAWSTATRNYLDANPTVNVIIWSWCGQVNGSEADINLYLSQMNQLEIDYPAVQFVYMTGHLDGTGATGNVNVRNNQIRNYCGTNNKILYDFADIESYDPDTLTNYMELLANDNCDYDSDGNGSRDANWATAWQSTHTLNTDWYNSGSAHSQPLNANQKAYAAWWLWARLAGWGGPNPIVDPTPPSVPQNVSATATGQTTVDVSWNASTDAESGVSRYRVYRDGSYIGQSSTTDYSDTGLTPGTTYGYTVSAVNGASVESAQSGPAAQATTQTDTEDPSVPANLSASAVSSTQIDLSWNASTDNVGVTGYRIYQNGSALPSTTTNTSYSVTGLSPNTQYGYTVAAFDAAGNESAQSSPTQYATTLDPSQTQYTLRLEDADTEVVDAFLSPGNPTVNYGSNGYTGSGNDRFIIQFILPTELLNKNILDAQLYLYTWAQENYADNQYVTAYRVTSPWVESQTTYNIASTGTPWSTTGGDYDQLIGQVEHPEGSANWDHTYYPPLDITSQMQRWSDGTDNNYGLILINEGTTIVRFKASEYSGHPYLDITYTDAPPSSPCDVNGDTGVNVCDVQLCVNVFLGTETDPALVAAADVNEDGEVNVVDVMLIVNEILGI